MTKAEAVATAQAIAAGQSLNTVMRKYVKFTKRFEKHQKGVAAGTSYAQHIEKQAAEDFAVAAALMEIIEWRIIHKYKAEIG